MVVLKYKGIFDGSMLLALSEVEVLTTSSSMLGVFSVDFWG